MDAMDLTISRAEQDDPATARGGTWLPSGEDILVICCCKATMSIGPDSDFEIAEDGRVTPAIECMQCGWNVNGILVGYRSQ